MPDDNVIVPGRLAFREEGEFWNAYFAAHDTMKDAVLLGSIRMNAVKASPDLRSAFMDLMRSLFEVAAKAAIGGEITWTGEEPAPQHERAGRG